MNKKNHLHKNSDGLLWALVALVPFVIMSVSFFYDHWTWGLMDDSNYLHQQGSWLSLLIKHLEGLYADGTLRPTYDIYTTTFYPLFENSPKLFYLFKLILVAVTLFLWGLIAKLLTGKPSALFLLPSISLSYYFFYDSTKYLSIQEPLGLFFLALSFLNFTLAGILPAQQQKRISIPGLCLGSFFLVFSVFSKEVFVSSGITLAAGLILTSLLYKNRSLIWWGIILFTLNLSYALFLKFFFQHGYSAGYSFSDWGKISWSIHDWWDRSLSFHTPWLFLMFVFGTIRLLKKESFAVDKLKLIGVLTGLSFYFLILFLLLPWSVSDFYAIPLGVFFGFLATILLVDELEKCNGWIIKSIIVFALIFNICVCYCSFGKMVAYRNDTIQLLDWIEYNQEFHTAMDQGWGVATNAWEAGVQIPDLLELRTGIKIPSFDHVTLVKEIVYTPKTMYYLYSPDMGDQDLRVIHQLYSVVFSSRSWTLFQRISQPPS